MFSTTGLMTNKESSFTIIIIEAGDKLKEVLYG